MLLIIGILIGTVLICIWMQKRNLFRQVYLTERLPGPPSYPIIGNGHMFVNKTARGKIDIIKCERN